MSAAEVATSIGIAHAAASYHLRQLAAAGLIEPIGRQARRARGRPLQRYRMRRDGLRGLRRASVRSLHESLLHEIERRLRVATKRSRTTDAEVWLEANDWREVLGLVERATAIVHRRALAPGGRRSKHVSFTSLLLELRK